MYDELLKCLRAIPNPSATIDAHKMKMTVPAEKVTSRSEGANKIPSNTKQDKTRRDISNVSNMFKRLAIDLDKHPSATRSPSANSGQLVSASDTNIGIVTESDKWNKIAQVFENLIDVEVPEMASDKADDGIKSTSTNHRTLASEDVIQTSGVSDISGKVGRSRPTADAGSGNPLQLKMVPDKKDSPSRSTGRKPVLKNKDKSSNALKPHRVPAGCTANVVLRVGMKVYVANAGDSRAVLCRGDGTALGLSEDHKPLHVSYCKVTYMCKV